MKRVYAVAVAIAMLCALPFSASSAKAQESSARHEDTRPLKTFYLKNAPQQNDANEVLVALRNILDPSTKIYLLASQNAIVVRATPDDMVLAQRLLDELDRPKPVYRLTYTLTETEGGKPVAAPRHISLTVASGQRATLKAGSKVPVLTGTYKTDAAAEQTQFTYLDVGMNFDATVTPSGDGAQLKTKVEESTISDEKSSVGLPDPLVRQTVIEGVTQLALGKRLPLGSFDMRGSTHRMEIEAEIEMLK